MATAGLREMKKSQTRRLIANTAARLFAQQGYENVSVSDVARGAQVSEQTVYNYFPTKEKLVTDNDQQVQDSLCALLRSRPATMSPAAAVRDFILDSVAHIARIPPDMWHGELGYLAAKSPSVHRLSLEMTDRLATALTEAIADSGSATLPVARVHATALAGVFQTIIFEAGHRTLDGQTQREIATALHAEVAAMLSEIDHWFTTE